ncbi:hypothetical protein C427_2359 [Paraglaciecola psychrophila 170]|uniref:Uncharacterized protein n=1 Tax=Paraglaciecola psychrophila 170 TaxID=1129794 RepID=K7A6Q5_9ALTE|nr:hypothetical protein C427_2359 [Paraglaciecola psychrophila 170]GAC38012.1 hypothetical protein GPSY_2391 [Paraglaciecola psychrophila 170]
MLQNDLNFHVNYHQYYVHYFQDYLTLAVFFYLANAPL